MNTELKAKRLQSEQNRLSRAQMWNDKKEATAQRHADDACLEFLRQGGQVSLLG